MPVRPTERQHRAGPRSDRIRPGRCFLAKTVAPANWSGCCVATTLPVEKVLQVFDHLLGPFPAFTAEGPGQKPWKQAVAGWQWARLRRWPCTMPAAAAARRWRRF